MDHGIGYTLAIGIAGLVLAVGGLTRAVTGIARARRMKRVSDANPCRGAHCDLAARPARHGAERSGRER